MENTILKEYVDKFNEFPILLKTISYEDEDYQFLMNNAINRGTPLTEEEISNYFGGNYDLVIDTNQKSFAKFGKNK